VHCVDRDDCAGEARERFEQVLHRGDLIRLLVHSDLAEHRADAVRQRRDQVQGSGSLSLPWPTSRRLGPRSKSTYF
jgi:hypothetical protein